MSGVTKIVIGRSAAARQHMFARPTLTEKLILNAPSLDVYIIPDADTEKVIYQAGNQGRKWIVFSAGDIVKSIGLLLAASLIGFFFYNLGIDEANIITVYVLSVLLTALVTKNRVYSLISSMSVSLFLIFYLPIPDFPWRHMMQDIPLPL